MLGRIGTPVKGARMKGNSLGNRLHRKDILPPFSMFYSLDGGGTADKIGVLHDFKDIDFSGTTPNDIDAAIAKPDSSSDVSSGVRGLGSMNLSHY